MTTQTAASIKNTMSAAVLPLPLYKSLLSFEVLLPEEPCLVTHGGGFAKFPTGPGDTICKQMRVESDENDSTRINHQWLIQPSPVAPVLGRLPLLRVYSKTCPKWIGAAVGTSWRDTALDKRSFKRFATKLAHSWLTTQAIESPTNLCTSNFQPTKNNSNSRKLAGSFYRVSLIP